MRKHDIVLVSLTLFLMSGCSALKSKQMNQVLDILGSDPAAKAYVADFKRYYSMAEKFKKFHDSGELSDGDVREVLREAGVTKAPPSTGGIKVSKGASPHSKSTQSQPAPMPNYPGAYRWPLDAGIVSSEFGSRWGKKHEGIDIAADMGVPLKSSADGVVIYAGSTMRGYGNTIVVRHDNSVTTLYAHAQSLISKKGDYVKQGQTIALLGNSGKSTGPHVHYEIREGELAVNPRTKLVKSAF